MPPLTLNGPAHAPASGGQARQLVVFLHGVGADGNDLIDLAGYFAQALPDAAFASPDAPFAYDMAPFGRQWFSLRDRSAGTVMEGVRIAAPYLDGFLDERLAALGLTDRELALVGFSQGTMMALQVGLRRPPCAAIVGFSGRLFAPEILARELGGRPPVLLIHGEDDPVVPFESLELARQGLEAMGVPVTTMARPGLGHSIDGEGLEAAIGFAARAFSS